MTFIVKSQVRPTALLQCQNNLWQGYPSSVIMVMLRGGIVAVTTTDQAPTLWLVVSEMAFTGYPVEYMNVIHVTRQFLRVKLNRLIWHLFYFLWFFFQNAWNGNMVIISLSTKLTYTRISGTVDEHVIFTFEMCYESVTLRFKLR